MSRTFEPRDAAYAERVRASFSRQSLMSTLGASIRTVEPGYVELLLPKRDGNLQQHGFVHGGAVAAMADTAAGYAALTLMPAGSGVLTVEFKINFLSPAAQESFVVRGRVEKPGRTLTVVRADVFGLEGEHVVPVAILSGTMMAMAQRDGVAD